MKWKCETRIQRMENKSIDTNTNATDNLIPPYTCFSLYLLFNFSFWPSSKFTINLIWKHLNDVHCISPAVFYSSSNWNLNRFSINIFSLTIDNVCPIYPCVKSPITISNMCYNGEKEIIYFWMESKNKCKSANTVLRFFSNFFFFFLLLQVFSVLYTIALINKKKNEI